MNYLLHVLLVWWWFSNEFSGVLHRNSGMLFDFHLNQDANNIDCLSGHNIKDQNIVDWYFVVLLINLMKYLLEMSQRTTNFTLYRILNFNQKDAHSTRSAVHQQNNSIIFTINIQIFTTNIQIFTIYHLFSISKDSLLYKLLFSTLKY